MKLSKNKYNPEFVKAANIAFNNNGFKLWDSAEMTLEEMSKNFITD